MRRLIGGIWRGRWRRHLKCHVGRLLQFVERRLGISSRLSRKFLISFSYLFRDYEDYKDALISHHARHRQPLRVLCVGCASGQEAYSVAIVCHDLGIPVTVIGADLSEKAIEVAKKGMYDLEREKEWSRGPDTKDAAARIDRYARYFVPQDTGGSAVKDEIRRNVSFEVRDVCDLPYVNEFDFVICRKMLYYLPAANREPALRSMLKALRESRGIEGIIFDPYTRSQPFFKSLTQRFEEVCGE